MYKLSKFIDEGNSTNKIDDHHTYVTTKLTGLPENKYFGKSKIKTRLLTVPMLNVIKLCTLRLCYINELRIGIKHFARSINPVPTRQCKQLVSWCVSRLPVRKLFYSRQYFNLLPSHYIDSNSNITFISYFTFLKR